jgi:hypothetical protein
MSTEVLAVIIGGIIGFVGGIVAAYIGAKVTTDRSRRFEALAKFRATFAPTLAKIRFVNDDNLVDFRLFLCSEITKQAAAIELFRPFIRNCRAFDQAERDYLQHLEIFDFHSIKEPTVEEPFGAGAASWVIKIIHKYQKIELLSEKTQSIIKSLLIAAENK